MCRTEVAEPLKMAQGSLAKLEFGFLGPRQPQELQPWQLKLKCHQREFLTEAEPTNQPSRSTWNCTPAHKFTRTNQPHFGWLLLCAMSTLELWWLSQALCPWVQSRVLQTQQVLCPVNNHSMVKLTWEREIKPLWCPSSPCSYGKCAAS